MRGLISRVVTVAALVVAAVASTLTLVSATTSPALVCGLSQRVFQEASGGVGVLSRANAFDTSGQQLCIRPAANDAPGFTVTTGLRYTGAWQAYPFTGVGCAYYLCSPRTDLPKKVRYLPSWANTSFSWRSNGASGYWNASYDIWFDKYDQISTEDNGAELMIWLRTPPGYTGGQLVRIGHREYWFMHWRACDPSHICWNYLQFRTTRKLGGVRDLWLHPFIAFLEGQGLVRPSWWLTSIHAGYELVSGGKGLQTTWFNAHA